MFAANNIIQMLAQRLAQPSPMQPNQQPPMGGMPQQGQQGMPPGLEALLQGRNGPPQGMPQQSPFGMHPLQRLGGLMGQPQGQPQQMPQGQPMPKPQQPFGFGRFGMRR